MSWKRSVRAAVYFVAFLAVPMAACGEDKIDRRPRRLETVTWNPNNHELVWVVAFGEKTTDGAFKSQAQKTYRILMDRATMSFNGENRRFSKQEAANVHMLMDLIAKYAVDSTVWWDQGQGQKIDKDTPSEGSTVVQRFEPPVPIRVAMVR